MPRNHARLGAAALWMLPLLFGTAAGLPGSLAHSRLLPLAGEANQAPPADDAGRFAPEHLLSTARSSVLQPAGGPSQAFEAVLFPSDEPIGAPAAGAERVAAEHVPSLARSSMLRPVGELNEAGEASQAPGNGGAERVTPEQLPLRVRGRYIVDARGARVKLACVNWAGHMEALIPEGLSHRPIADIAAQVMKREAFCLSPVYSKKAPRGIKQDANFIDDHYVLGWLNTGGDVSRYMRCYLVRSHPQRVSPQNCRTWQCFHTCLFCSNGRCGVQIADLGFNCVRLTYAVETVQRRQQPAADATTRQLSAGALAGLKEHNPWALNASVWEVRVCRRCMHA